MTAASHHDEMVPGRKPHRLRQSGKKSSERIIGSKSMHDVPAGSRGSLQGLKEFDEVVDLIGFELELRHAGMPGHGSFGEGLLKLLDRIAHHQQ